GFAALVKDHDVTLEHVRSASQMKALIESGTWDVVVYLGHGVMTLRALDPGHEVNNPFLTMEDLASALKTAQAKRVHLDGCRAGSTGLARKLSEQLPGTVVYGTFDMLDVSWEQGVNKQGPYNVLKLNQPPTEYTNGKQTVNGIKTPQRPHEMGDPI